MPTDPLPANPYRGTDLWRLVHGVDLLHEIIDKVLPAATPVWILPAGLLPGVTRAWGIPVRRVAELDVPYLAFEVADPDVDRDVNQPHPNDASH